MAHNPEADPHPTTPAPIVPASPRDSPDRFGDARDRFFDLRLGLFLHWGLYAIPAWQEQDQWRRNWPRERYARLMRRFHPRRFEPEHWIETARSIGGQYLCFTAKHADGFCLWDSDLTEYKSTRTPFGRDIVAELATACARASFPLRIYYSVVDEHHPAYPHAGRRWEYRGPQPGDRPDRDAYLAYLRGQVEELCTRYGPLDGFWWDGNIAGWQDPAINARIRELQPGILINNRGMDPGDYGTPERDWDAEADAQRVFPRATEACQALGSQSWGHRRHEDYYTTSHLLRSIAKTLAKGGAYLLNTGPRADGSLAPADLRILRRIGDWFARAREAFDGTVPASHEITSPDFVATRRGSSTLYVMPCRPAVTRAIPLKPLRATPRTATDLISGRKLAVRCELLPWDHGDGIAYPRIYDIPERLLESSVPVIRLDF